MTLIRKTNRNLDSILNDFIGGDFFTTSNGWYNGGCSYPAVNIKEDEDNYYLELAAPGLEKNDFTIEYDNGKLKVSANKENNPKGEEKGEYTKREFNYHCFSREFVVSPKKVDDSVIEASYENGILKIFLPKREEAKPKPARQVSIS